MLSVDGVLCRTITPIVHHQLNSVFITLSWGQISAIDFTAAHPSQVSILLLVLSRS